MSQSNMLASQDLHHVPDGKPTFACGTCSETIALQDELCSKSFTGKSGRAFLVNSTINTDLGQKEERKLLTGTHTCADLLCASCGSYIGWKYLVSPNGAQKYKESRYILELAQIVRENHW